MTRTGSLLKLGADRTLYMGGVESTSWHRHGAPVLLIALGGEFRIEFRDGQVESCRSALIDIHVEHQFTCPSERFSAILLEPDAPELESLRRQFLWKDSTARKRAAFDLIATPRSRGRFERHLHAFDWDGLLRSPLRDRRPTELDERVARALPELRYLPERRVARSVLAERLGLSESRFNHLFSQQAGICFRRYRLWSQLRTTLAQIPSHRNFTTAALQCGFADSSHFSRAFRDLVGTTPSVVLKDCKVIERI